MPSPVNSHHIARAYAYLRSAAPSIRPSHDWVHAVRVHNLAVHLALSLPRTAAAPDLALVRLSALVHDLFDHKLAASPADAPCLLRELLTAHIGLDTEATERVAFICENLSYSKQRRHPLAEAARTIELDLVQDADRLEAIGAVGIARCLAYTGEVGATLTSARRHFEDKLIKLKGLMRTNPGGDLAEKRHQVLLDFVAAFDGELCLAGQNPVEDGIIMTVLEAERLNSWATPGNATDWQPV